MKLLSTSPNETYVKSIYQSLPKNLICFSHLRWDFVFQRPQHLLTRLSKTFNIFYLEEPICDAAAQDYYSFLNRGENVVIIVPHIRPGLSAEETKAAQKALFDKFMENRNTSDHGFWYYTPMALEFTRKYTPEVTVFDCMDELSAFKFAPEELKTLEKELLQKADIVFTGGHSLFEAKKNQHSNIYAFPSSIDKAHFMKARRKESNAGSGTPPKRPKLGFYGVIDERFDVELIGNIAEARPDWDIILIGPVVKIDPAILPNNANIQYLGSKNYKELPDLMAAWDIALIPFLLNDSTRFISPTKTPEYLAAGLPVISTAIRDVINPYGKNKLVKIGVNAEDFVMAAEQILSDLKKEEWLKRVDAFLTQNSWDQTCSRMLKLIEETANRISYTSIAQ